jgi:hypothetical protein
MKQARQAKLHFQLGLTSLHERPAWLDKPSKQVKPACLGLLAGHGVRPACTEWVPRTVVVQMHVATRWNICPSILLLKPSYGHVRTVVANTLRREVASFPTYRL